MNKVQIMAHRGASWHAPENTRASFLKAYDFKADGIETDLQLTGDGKIVIHHNYYIDDTSDGTGAIVQKTVEELKKYDFGSYKGDEYAGERILTLEELLPILRDMSVINLELKPPVSRGEDFVGKILSIVADSGMEERIIYSSFDAGLLRELKKRNPRCKVGLLTFYEKTQPFKREMTAAFAAAYPVEDVDSLLESAGKRSTLTELVDSLDFQIDDLHPDYHSVLDDPKLVERMHERKIGVNPYTCDREEEIRRLMEAGCDGIITNRPDIAGELAGNEKWRF